MDKERNMERKQGPDCGSYVAMGLCFGTAFGVLINQVALGPAIGLLVATVAYQIALMRDRKAQR